MVRRSTRGRNTQSVSSKSNKSLSSSSSSSSTNVASKKRQQQQLKTTPQPFDWIVAANNDVAGDNSTPLHQTAAMIDSANATPNILANMAPTPARGWADSLPTPLARRAAQLVADSISSSNMSPPPPPMSDASPSSSNATCRRRGTKRSAAAAVDSPTASFGKRQTAKKALREISNTSKSDANEAGTRRTATVKRKAKSNEEQQRDKEYEEFVARMNAHFDTVDEYDMTVESVSASERRRLDEAAHAAQIERALASAERQNAALMALGDDEQFDLDAADLADSADVLATPPPARVALTPDAKRSNQRFALRRVSSGKTRRERLQKQFPAIAEKGKDALAQELAYVGNQTEQQAPAQQRQPTTKRTNRRTRWRK